MALLKNKYNLICVVTYFLVLSTFYFFNFNLYDNVIFYIINFFLCFTNYSILFFRNRNLQEISFKEILIIALILRAVMIFVTPITSDDFYRYLWDGKVQSEGINPYPFSPLELIQLQDKVIYPNVSFPEIKTIYPPVSQVIFFLSYIIFGPNVWGLKIIFLIFDFGIMIFLYKTLNLLKINSNYIILYALAPLVIFEFFINAHIDIVILFFLIVSFYFALKKEINLSFLFLGFSVLSKIYSIIFLPIYILYFYKSMKDFKKLTLGMICMLIPFLIILFYMNGFINIFSTIENYMTYWYSNNLLYKIIFYVSELAGVSNHMITRIILLLLFTVSYFIILKSRIDFIYKIYFTAFCYLFFSHTVHPWYLTLLVLFLPIYFNYAVYFWSGIIGLTNLTVYYYLKDRVWHDIVPVLIFEYVLLAILVLIDLKTFKLNLLSNKN